MLRGSIIFQNAQSNWMVTNQFTKEGPLVATEIIISLLTQFMSLIAVSSQLLFMIYWLLAFMILMFPNSTVSATMLNSFLLHMVPKLLESTLIHYLLILHGMVNIGSGRVTSPELLISLDCSGHCCSWFIGYYHSWFWCFQTIKKIIICSNYNTKLIFTTQGIVVN